MSPDPFPRRRPATPQRSDGQAPPADDHPHSYTDGHTDGGQAGLQPHSTGAQPYGTSAYPRQPYQTGPQPYPGSDQPYPGSDHLFAAGAHPYADGSQPARPYPTGAAQVQGYGHPYPTGSQPVQHHGYQGRDGGADGYLHPGDPGGEAGARPFRRPVPGGPAQGPATSETAALAHPTAGYPGGDDADPWQRPRPDRHTDPHDTPGPWPTRVSGPPAIAAVVLVIVAGVVAVIALPRILGNGQADEVHERTALSQPSDVAGLPRLPDDQVTDEDKRSAEQLLSAVATPLAKQTMVYGKATGVRVAVVTGRPRSAIADNELEILRNGFTTGMESAGAPVQELDTGTLGGWIGCGQAGHGKTLCLALDHGAVVSITVTNKDPSAFILARAAREAVEHRD